MGKDFFRAFMAIAICSLVIFASTAKSSLSSMALSGLNKAITENIIRR